MVYPIAEGFKNGTLIKPTVSKEVFYQGGLLVMQKRFREHMKPFRGAYSEFLSRSDGLDYSDVVYVMWDYLSLV
jgi:hypothetical protein